MSKTATSCPVSQEGWEPQDKPRCRSCGGETTQVLASYGTNKPQLEWECMLCGKSFKADGKTDYKDYKKKQKYTVYKPQKKQQSNRRK
jgi:hypothetical protein